MNAPDTAKKPGRIDLPGGWYLVRCDDAKSPHNEAWFLSDPEGVWVATFWDGPSAGQGDCYAFAAALGVKVDEGENDPA